MRQRRALFVKFVHAKGLTAKREIRVETLGGVIVPRLEDDGEVSVDMGPPAVEMPLLQKIALKDEIPEVDHSLHGQPALPSRWSPMSNARR